MSRIHRLLRLITMLQSGRSYSARELAEELEVSRRTVFRDLNVLEMAHVPYYYDQETGGYRINDHFFLPAVNLTLSEALGMVLLAGRVRTSQQLPPLDEAARAAVKVESALPPVIRDHVGTLVEKVNFSMAPVSAHEGHHETFEQLARAIVRRLSCRLVYISFYEKRQITTTVRPLRLVFHARAWYLIAYSVAHGEIRTFKLARIRKLTVTDRTFNRPRDVDLADYFGDAWSMIPEGRLYNVHLHFEPKVAGNVAEVRWHHSQRVEWNEDGSMEFTATVDGLGEIGWWVLGYGDQVEVVSPKRLRRRIARTARATAQKYQRERV
ncbi:MAG: helix-turn-helix transcriptional regulator [Phycisphaerae bacterium]